MADFRQATELLKAQAGAQLSYDPIFTPLTGQTAQSYAAVDGSHAILVDNGAAWIVAVRADFITWPGRPIEKEATIFAASPKEAERQVSLRYEAHGLPPPRVLSCDQFAEAHRELSELEAALSALRTKPDILLVDGALEHLSYSAQPLADHLLVRAAEVGVSVTGVAKGSRLDDDGLPLVKALMDRGPDGAWKSQVPDYETVTVCKLHPRAPFAFRVDGNPEPLLPVSKDAVYLGYPYPLAVAHNHVCITGTEANMLRSQLVQEASMEAGPSAYKLLEDFHETLDRNVP